VVALEAYWARWTGAYAGVAQFICPSAAMRDAIARYGIDRARLRLLPYFVPSELLDQEPGEQQTERQAESPLFLFVGRLVAEKGGLWLARAAADLGLPIAFVGDGPQRAAITALGGDFPHLRCLGWADPPTVQAWMRRATALIVPSLWPDNSPMVIYEASALGLPVVGARVGGIPELVREGETGLLFERGDAAGLRAALRRLAGDPALRTRLSAGARARARTEWTADRHVDQLLEIYAQAIRAGC